MLDRKQWLGAGHRAKKIVIAKIAMTNKPIGKTIPSTTLLIIDRVPSSYDLVIL